MPAIKLEKLEKVYENRTHALKGIDLEIKEGDFFGLLGPNGAGKSTTISIISSLARKTSGKVYIAKNDIDTDLNKAKALLGIVPQETNLAIFEKAIDIVVNQAGFYGIPKNIAEKRAEKYLKVLQLWDKRNEITRNLSGGMKRRLMIARALVHEPQILILDEPTAGVDIEIRHLIWEFLKELNHQGKTIVLTSHYLEEVEHLCKNLAIINEGRLIKHGTVKSITNKLEKESFEATLATPLKNRKLLEAFENVGYIDKNTVEITLHGNDLISEVLAKLDKNGIKVKTIRNKINKLEELFLQLTKKVN